jgi:hypothetical protein
MQLEKRGYMCGAMKERSGLACSAWELEFERGEAWNREVEIPSMWRVVKNQLIRC